MTPAALLPTLGDPLLDREHDAFLVQVLAFKNANGAAALNALSLLRDQARVHFAGEDADLQCLGGANARCHLEEHAAVLRSLDEVHALLSDPGVPPELYRQLVDGLSAELLRWLPVHVREMDEGLVAARIRSRFGGARVTLTPKLNTAAVEIG